MKNLKFLTLALLISYSFISTGQPFHINNKASTLTVLGTSTLIDWELDAKEIIGNAEFNISDKALKDILSLSIKIPVASLKSGLDVLDDHMITAMTINNSSSVTFIMDKITELQPNSTNEYVVKAEGKLTIAKNTKPVSLQSTIKIKEDKSIRIFGKIMINMVDFSVKPPELTMGSIKTGKDVEVVFDVIFVK